MKRTLYILTKFIGERGHPELDEFVTDWILPFKLDEAVLEAGGRKVVLIHGHYDRFPEQDDDDRTALQIRDAVSNCPSNGGECALLCHPKNPNMALKPYFPDFVFAAPYSVGASRGEWPLINQLRYCYNSKLVIKDVARFESAFDHIWDFFRPEQTRRQDLESQHQALANLDVPLVPKSPENNQTEHYLLIWNTISGRWFQSRLIQHIHARHNKPVHVAIVSSRDEFSRIDWAKNWRKVFVLAELHWSDMDFEGVPCVLDILEKRGEDRLEILLCSVWERKALHNISQDLHRMVVKSFPLLHLTGTPDFSLLERMHVSNRKWRYKRAELLDEREILQSLLHDLKNLQPRSRDFLQQVELFCANAYGLRSLLDAASQTEIARLRALADSPSGFSTEYAEQCLSAMKNALDRLLTERNAAIAPIKRQARIMIVDDDWSYRERLRDLFDPWFTQIQVYDSGTTALDDLKRDPYGFDALVTDLELLDDGLEDLVQGVDLVDFCERSAKWIALRVVTGLPRNSIPKRLSDFKNDRIILKQRDKAEEHEAPFILPHFDEGEFMAALSKEIDDLAVARMSKERHGPHNGKFADSTTTKESPGLTAWYYEIRNTGPNELTRGIDEVIERVKKFLLDPNRYPVNTKFARTDNKLRATWQPLLWTLLAHRLIAIGYQMREGGKIKYMDYSDGTGLFFDLFPEETPKSAPKDKKLRNDLRRWFNTLLGFSFKQIDPDTKGNEQVRVKLEYNEQELFPHEQKWKDTVDMYDFTRLGSQLSADGCAEIKNEIQGMLPLIENQDAHPAVVLMGQFSEATSFSDFRIVMSYLEEIPNKQIGKPFKRVLTILDNEIEDAAALINIPDWLEQMIERYRA